MMWGEGHLLACRGTGGVRVTGIRLSFFIVGSCIAMAAAAAPAGAAAVSARGPALTLSVPVVTAKIPVLKSTATAGYISEKRGIKSVSTTFEVPKITSCKAGQNAGLGPVVILAGSGYFVGAGAEAACQDGTLSYMVAINHNGTETHPLSVAARNEISVDVTIRSKSVLVTIENLSTKKKVSQSVAKGKVTEVELGDDSLSQGSHEVAIPKFTSHQFTHVRINGKVLKDATPLLDEELVRGKTILVKPGPVSSGDAFVMHFEHAT
jgi:hypothetical protein